MTVEQSVLRRTPLFEIHQEAGAKLVPFAGWEMPVQYDGIKEEHIAVRTHAGIFDVSHMGQIEVEGPGSLAFLQRLVTNDVAKIEVGGAQYSLLLNEDAGVIDDLFVYRLAHDRYLVITNAGNHTADLAQFGLVARDFDVYVRDASANYAMLAVQGPNARRILEHTLHVDLPPRMKVGARQIGRRPALVCGTGYTGEDGVELLIDPEIAPAIWTELVDAGVVPCGLGARDTLRLEVCFHLHGNDLTTETDPISAGLGWACVEATGFIGSDKVAVLRANGIDEKLAPFVIEGAGIPRQGNPVMLGEETVGEVTSGTFSPSLARGIGMAYLRSDLAESETELEIDVRGKRRTARVSSKPLYEKER
ncbi:MAG: glycine cleavage system aminomethyltransferase GcvT [Solirubrobacterales bacterium]|mgnify:FL=1|nr:glycine cleavage system aminomethyltransferase GcvT [Solirubrobacterales bacterium]OJU95245.1 MAG: glycine cleavage system protein T [Solirubrobacterales bacterium 67-14]